MKNYGWVSWAIILAILVFVYYVYRTEVKRENRIVLNSDEMVIKVSLWDSIVAIENMPPVIKIDTFYIKGKTEYVEHNNGTPIESKDSINTYKDSVVNDNIDVHLKLRVKGTLLSTAWEYSPIYREIKVDNLVYVPKIVEHSINVPISKSGIYFYGVTGGNQNSFLFGGGVDYITKKDREIGYMYQRFGKENFHSIKYGIRFRVGK